MLDRSHLLTRRNMQDVEPDMLQGDADNQDRLSCVVAEEDAIDHARIIQDDDCAVNDYPRNFVAFFNRL